MTTTATFFQPGIRLLEWFEVTKKTITERRAQRSAYVNTLRTLQSLSDHDLADIGISRSSIEDIAHRDAFGDPR